MILMNISWELVCYRETWTVVMLLPLMNATVEMAEWVRQGARYGVACKA